MRAAWARGRACVHVGARWKPSLTASAVLCHMLILRSVTHPVCCFPGSFATLAAYAHSRNLTLGAYLDEGNHTCDWGHAKPPGGDGEHPWGPGSYMHEEADVATLVSWGVDQIKMDGCYRPDNNQRYWDGYSSVAAAINASGRKMWFACEAMMCVPSLHV